MSYRLKESREAAGLSVMETAKLLEVSSSSVCNWESGRRQPQLENLVAMSALYGVSIDYLLGQGSDAQTSDMTVQIDRAALPVYHSQPVWLPKRGWALVNGARRELLFADCSVMAFDELVDHMLYAFPPTLTCTLPAVGKPLDVDDIMDCTRVWVEPISEDVKLRKELRGWYRPHDGRLVQNELGNRFYLDAYGAKWLAFKHI